MTSTNEFIAKKPTLEKHSRCLDSYVYMESITSSSNDLFIATNNNSNPKVKDLIEGYAIDYVDYIGLTTIGLKKPECVDVRSPL